MEDNEDKDKGRDVLVLFDFDVLLNQTGIAMNLPQYDDYKEDNKIREMPWLNIMLADCNCSHYPHVANVAVRSGLGLPALEIQSSDSCKESDSDRESERESEREFSDADGSAAAAAFADTVEEETLFTEYFKLKGSTYHDHFQKALRQCKRLMLDKKEVAVQLVIEPANVADENAIIVQAELDSMWHPVGYIPGVKVKKAMNAINKEEIKTIRYKSIEWKYIYALGEFRYFSSIVITKRNRWLPSDKDYQYNAKLY